MSVAIFFYSPPYIKAELRYVEKRRGLSEQTPPPLYKAMLNGVLLLSATYPPLFIEAAVSKLLHTKTQTPNAG
jgi:hypothetical protein